MSESLNEALAHLRATWPEFGCGGSGCCVRRERGMVMGTCRCVQTWKDGPGSQPFHRLLDAARRVVEAPVPEPTSLAEAIHVALDHAEDTGEYSDDLRQRIAKLLPNMKIATGWAEDNAWVQRCGPDGMIVAMVSVTSLFAEVCIVGPMIRSDTQKTEDNARAWCDEHLRANGWILIGGTDEVHR